MTNQELHQLATEYAEQNPPADIKDEVLKRNTIGLNAEIFEKFLVWLTKTHCIVSRTDAADWVKNASEFMPAYNLKVAMQIGAKRLFGSELFEERSEK